MAAELRAEMEVIHFLLGRPSPEDIIAFRPSPAVSARLYALIEQERAGPLGEAESHELESYMYLEHLMRLLKVEAHRQLEQQPA
jgi:hypothetical protein